MPQGLMRGTLWGWGCALCWRPALKDLQEPLEEVAQRLLAVLRVTGMPCALQSCRDVIGRASEADTVAMA